MADNKTVFRGGNAELPPAGGTAGTTSAAGTSEPAGAKSIMDVVALCQSPSVLSKEAEEYIEKIADSVTASGRNAKVEKVVGSNYEARVIDVNGKLACFIFAETYQPGVERLPIASCINDFRSALEVRKMDPNAIEQFIVVTKDDYAKVDAMAAFITNMYMSFDSSTFRDFSIAAFQNGNFHITTDMNAVRQFVQQSYPLATPPRGDVGLLLYMTTPIKNSMETSGRQEYRTTPLVAVTGYTDFVHTMSGDMWGQAIKFAPHFHISGVYSKLVNTQIGSVAIALASFLFIRQGRWVEQFSTYDQVKPDLGCLLEDDKGRPMHCANQNDRNGIIEKCMLSRFPFLLLDLQVGAPMIPGLRKILEDKAAFNALVDGFSGGKGATNAGNPVQIVSRRADGRVCVNKSGAATMVDTRTVDYIFLVQSGVLPAEVKDFLRPTYDFELKRNALTQRYDAAELLYTTFQIMLNPAWVDGTSMDIGQTLHVSLEGNFAPNTYDVASCAQFQPMGMNMLPGFIAAGNTNMFNGSFFC